jgi:Uma2 family endonuclease
VKLPLYARAGIAEAWLVDLSEEVVERQTEPSGGGYRLVRRAGREEKLESAALAGLILSVDAVLG